MQVHACQHTFVVADTTPVIREEGGSKNEDLVRLIKGSVIIQM